MSFYFDLGLTSCDLSMTSTNVCDIHRPVVGIASEMGHRAMLRSRIVYYTLTLGTTAMTAVQGACYLGLRCYIHWTSVCLTFDFVLTQQWQLFLDGWGPNWIENG